MKKRNRKQTDQEWMDLIQDCRTSGLTNKQWCEEKREISPADTAVRLVFKGVPVEITNAASMDAVFHAISVLEKLC